MTLHEMNTLSVTELKRQLFNCCGSTNWVNRMITFFPMDDLVELLEDAEEQWYECTAADWQEAFNHHTAYGVTASAEEEFDDAAFTVAREAYKNKFGYAFVAADAEITASKILAVLQQRLENSPEEEITTAMDEQNKITLNLIQKLIS